MIKLFYKINSIMEKVADELLPLMMVALATMVMGFSVKVFHFELTPNEILLCTINLISGIVLYMVGLFIAVKNLYK